MDNAPDAKAAAIEEDDADVEAVHASAESADPSEGGDDDGEDDTGTGDGSDEAEDGDEGRGGTLSRQAMAGEEDTGPGDGSEEEDGDEEEDVDVGERGILWSRLMDDDGIHAIEYARCGRRAAVKAG